MLGESTVDTPLFYFILSLQGYSTIFMMVINTLWKSSPITSTLLSSVPKVVAFATLYFLVQSFKMIGACDMLFPDIFTSSFLPREHFLLIWSTIGSFMTIIVTWITITRKEKLVPVRESWGWSCVWFLSPISSKILFFRCFCCPLIFKLHPYIHNLLMLRVMNIF